jgi:hypothetical protein
MAHEDGQRTARSRVGFDLVQVRPEVLKQFAFRFGRIKGRYRHPVRLLTVNGG